MHVYPKIQNLLITYNLLLSKCILGPTVGDPLKEPLFSLVTPWHTHVPVKYKIFLGYAVEPPIVQSLPPNINIH